MNYTRRGNKWTVNEILSLQREYELLEMDIQEIALKHGRSVQAILYKLDKEEIINNWNDARGYNNYLNKSESHEGEYVYGDDQYVSDDDDYIETQDASDDDSYDVSDDEQDVSDDDESDDDDEIVNLTRRVGYVENTVNEIKNLITNLLKSINNNISITSSLEA